MPVSEKLKDLLNQISSNKYTDETLSLAEQKIDDEALKALVTTLKENTHIIKELDLSNNQITAEGVKCLKDVNIEKLKLSGNLIGDGALIFKESEYIKELILEGCNINNSVAKEIFQNIKLKLLDLSSNDLGDEAVQDIPKGSALETIILFQNEIESEGAKLLAKHPHVNKLDLGLNSIDDEAIESFVENKNLVKLNLTQNKITEKGFLKLCESTSLKELSLFNNIINLNDKDSLPKNSSLVKVSLASNRLADQCAKILKNLAAIPTLIELDLDYNEINKEAVQVLYAYKEKEKPTLQVSLLGNPGYIEFQKEKSHLKKNQRKRSRSSE